MLDYKQISKRKFQLLKDDEEIFTFNFEFNPSTNKSEMIFEFLKDCSNLLGEEFDNWYSNFIIDYLKNNFDATIIKNNVPNFEYFTNEYLKKKEINFGDCINKEKSSKTSIFFDIEEIEPIIKTSCKLKFYFPIFNDPSIKLPQKSHKEIYNTIIEEINSGEILYKIFKLVSSKTYTYSFTDNYMWEYLEAIYCKTTDIHIITIFNFIINNILVTCDATKNPISYINSVIDSSIRFMLKNIYKDQIIYSDAISTEDAHHAHGKDNLKTYAYNDTIGRLAIHAYNYLEECNIDESELKSTISNSSQTPLSSQYFTYPILSKALDIPYKHLTTLPNEHAILLNILLYHAIPETIKIKYPILINFLFYWNNGPEVSKTTYKLKNIDNFIKSLESFLGFKEIKFVYDFYSSIIGKLTKNDYLDIRTNKNVKRLSVTNLENELIDFYNKFFNGNFDDEFENLGKELEKYL